ncbi:MAG: methyltransferase, partial [bacterium]
FYYGNDSLALSRRLLPAEGRVLDLCSGVGTQALLCAQTADSVTAVEIEPLAEPIFRINAELNGLGGKVEFLVGDLLEPLAGRQFDRICCNPPFMPAPPALPYPLFAGGGPDGLSVVRRLLAALPEILAPEGQCHIVGAVPGNMERPDVSMFEKLAVEARLRLELECPTCEALEGPTMAAIAGTALTGEAEAAEMFRAHFAMLGATHLYCFLLRATHASRPSLYLSHHGGQTATVWN